MATAKEEPFKICPEVNPAAYLEREISWYNNAVKQFKDRWEERVLKIKIPVVRNPTILRDIETQIDDITGELAPVLRQYKAIEYKLIEGQKTLISIEKSKRAGKFPKEAPKIREDFIKKEIAEHGLDDTLALIQAKLSYLKSVDDRLQRKITLLNVEKGHAFKR